MKELFALTQEPSKRAEGSNNSTVALSTLAPESSGSRRTQRYNRLSFSGVVERVWEDGFFLNTGDRTLSVDAWSLYRDATPRYVSVGTPLTVSGEFEGRDFDAFSITLGDNSGGNSGNNSTGDSDAPMRSDRLNVIRGTNGSDDLRGGAGRDRLIGLVGNDDLFGGAGNDILIGGGGGDDLLGGDGNDILRGGRGQDDLIGGAGRDILIGGPDRDTFVLQPQGNDIIRDFQNGVDELGLSGGLRFNDLVFEQRGQDTLILADGNRVALLLGINANSITPADLD
jgi:Ca2+-binding RTX toxin-like protein